MSIIRGVDRYTVGSAIVPIFFPGDDVRCQNCRFCRYSEGMKRYWCQLTDRQVYAPFDGIADHCPITFEGEDT